MTATFYREGRGFSLAAMDAHSEGKFSASQVAKRLGVSAKQVAESGAWDGEWHHVGKFASRVNYYSVDAVAVALYRQGAATKKLTAWIAENQERVEAVTEKRVMEMVSAMRSRMRFATDYRGSEPLRKTNARSLQAKTRRLAVLAKRYGYDFVNYGNLTDLSWPAVQAAFAAWIEKKHEEALARNEFPGGKFPPGGVNPPKPPAPSVVGVCRG